MRFCARQLAGAFASEPLIWCLLMSPGKNFLFLKKLAFFGLRYIGGIPKASERAELSVQRAELSVRSGPVREPLAFFSRVTLFLYASRRPGGVRGASGGRPGGVRDPVLSCPCFDPTVHPIPGRFYKTVLECSLHFINRLASARNLSWVSSTQSSHAGIVVYGHKAFQIKQTQKDQGSIPCLCCACKTAAMYGIHVCEDSANVPRPVACICSDFSYRRVCMQLPVEA